MHHAFPKACECAQSSRAMGGMRLLESPLLLKGTVVRGFGRGSKELGIPTANLDTAALEASGALAGSLAGIYAGWAVVYPPAAARAEKSANSDSVTLSPELSSGSGGHLAPTIHKMVMSIGWNPHFKNETKTVEPHLLHIFPADFYGAELRLVVVGWLRPEASFSSLDALIAAIHGDIADARRELDAAAAAPTGAAAAFLAALPPPAEAASEP